jgi:hypothetical protein
VRPERKSTRATCTRIVLLVAPHRLDHGCEALDRGVVVEVGEADDHSADADVGKGVDAPDVLVDRARIDRPGEALGRHWTTCA